MNTEVIGLVNLGCAKNLVDAELMLGILSKKGYKITLSDEGADIILVNTCSFIKEAEKESVKQIVELAEAGKKLIISGCLAQKYKKELMEAVPEALAIVGTGDIDKIGEIVDKLAKGTDEAIYEVTDNPKYIQIDDIDRFQITVGSSAYIKIAEGCDYSCAYCIIPALRGPYRSRTIESIVKEAKKLGEIGVNEVVLVAQDTTNYGKDIYGKPSLSKLLEALNEVEEIDWIRIMYAYPSLINDDLVKAIANLDKVVKYLDIPLQHSHPDMLRAMDRPAMDNAKVIKKLREGVPGMTIRTAFIVGFPGETEEHFEHLYNFIEECRFDKMGVFQYSREKNTSSYAMKPQILVKVKKERQKALMQLQQGISLDINNSFVGKEIDVIVETLTSSGKIIGRSFRDAPEIDGLVYIETDKPLSPGDIIPVKITKADVYDLYGKY